MVHLVLASRTGNHGVRYFPYTGYLGLTTLKVEGVVRTKLDADQKPLQAKSITISVRCYETRLGVLGVIQSNVLVDYTKVLWSKPDEDHNEYSDVGNMELPFRISIPAKVAGFSTASYSSVYKCSWRVEAIINHVPILGVGSRQIKHSELPLLRFGLPPAYEPSTPIAKPLLDSEISQPHSPPIRYSVNSPTTPIGPLDLVSIPIHLLPSDPTVAVRSASVIIERRMRFLDPSSPPSTPTLPSNTSPTSTLPSLHPSSSLPIPQRTSSSSSSLASPSPSSSYTESSSYLSSSTAALQPPDSRSSTTGASLLVNSVAGTESSGLFARSESGMWSKTLTLQWPATKSHSRWAIGETLESELVSVKFFVRVKIVVSSSSGTESLELEEKELLVVSTNDAERQLALSKYNDSYSDGARSKSKSPRRSSRRTDEDINVPPLPASASRAEHSHRVSSSTSHYSSGSPSSKPPRRPHTSAGPRDKSRTGAGSVSASDAETKDTERRDPFRRRRGTRPDTGNGTGANAEIAASHRDGSKGYFHAPPVPLTVTTTPVDSGGSASSTSLSTSTSSSSVDSNPSDEVREWEEELARIEMRSRRSSDLVGFANKRRRPAETP